MLGDTRVVKIQVSDREEVATRSRGDDRVASDTRNRADVKEDSKVVRTKSSKKKAKTTVYPVFEFSFHGEMRHRAQNQSCFQSYG